MGSEQPLPRTNLSSRQTGCRPWCVFLCRQIVDLSPQYGHFNREDDTVNPSDFRLISTFCRQNHVLYILYVPRHLGTSSMVHLRWSWPVALKGNWPSEVAIVHRTMGVLNLGDNHSTMFPHSPGWWFFATPLKNHGVKVGWDDFSLANMVGKS